MITGSYLLEPFKRLSNVENFAVEGVVLPEEPLVPLHGMYLALQRYVISFSMNRKYVGGCNQSLADRISQGFCGGWRHAGVQAT